MDHLLRNSENGGRGDFGRPVFQPQTSLFQSHSGACARVREAEYCWTAPKRCIYCIKAKVYTHCML